MLETDTTTITSLGHSPGNWVQTTPPTCTDDGEETGTCVHDNCNEPNIPRKGEDAIEHYFNWTISPGNKTCTNNDCIEVIPVTIGDIGPAGGVIFHISLTGFPVHGYSDGIERTAYLNYAPYTAYYLEVNLNNISGQMWCDSPWGDAIAGLSQDLSDEIDWEIGRGRLNTAIIIAGGVNHTLPFNTPAASFCSALTAGSKNDWFLPSKNELNTLKQFYGHHGIPDWGYFWSSSQAGGGAWTLFFSDDIQANTGKRNSYGVLAIRAF